MKLLVVQYETAFSIELRDGWINSHPNCPRSTDGGKVGKDGSDVGFQPDDC